MASATLDSTHVFRARLATVGIANASAQAVMATGIDTFAKLDLLHRASLEWETMRPSSTC